MVCRKVAYLQSLGPGKMSQVKDQSLRNTLRFSSVLSGWTTCEKLVSVQRAIHTLITYPVISQGTSPGLSVLLRVTCVLCHPYFSTARTQRAVCGIKGDVWDRGWTPSFSIHRQKIIGLKASSSWGWRLVAERAPVAELS